MSNFHSRKLSIYSAEIIERWVSKVVLSSEKFILIMALQNIALSPIHFMNKETNLLLYKIFRDFSGIFYFLQCTFTLKHILSFPTMIAGAHVPLMKK